MATKRVLSVRVCWSTRFRNKPGKQVASAKWYDGKYYPPLAMAGGDMCHLVALLSVSFLPISSIEVLFCKFHWVEGHYYTSFHTTSSLLSAALSALLNPRVHVLLHHNPPLRQQTQFPLGDLSGFINVGGLNLMSTSMALLNRRWRLSCKRWSCTRKPFYWWLVRLQAAQPWL